MKSSFKFSVSMIFMLMTALSGCIYPGERWDHDRGGRDEHGDRGGDHGGDRGDRGGRDDEDGYRR